MRKVLQNETVDFLQNSYIKKMAHIKTCPQCGNEFEGRSNKVYCSDKCKMAAFKENQVLGDDNDFSTMEIITPKKEKQPKDQNEQERILTLQLELRKLELAHLEKQALITAEERQNERYFELQKRDKERNFELEKLKMSYEQEKVELLKKVETLQGQLSEAEQDEIEDDEEDIERPLPQHFQAAYKDAIQTFLDNEGETLYRSDIEAMQADLKDLGRKIVSYAEKQGYDKTDFQAYDILKRINEVCKDLIAEIESKGFFEAKCTSYTIDEDSREELEAEIK